MYFLSEKRCSNFTALIIYLVDLQGGGLAKDIKCYLIICTN